MTIHLRPELEALVPKDVEQGPYQSVDEFAGCAVRMLHDQEQWLADNREEIAAKSEAGYASAERGDMVDGEEARVLLNERERNGSSRIKGDGSRGQLLPE